MKKIIVLAMLVGALVAVGAVHAFDGAKELPSNVYSIKPVVVTDRTRTGSAIEVFTVPGVGRCVLISVALWCKSR